VPPRRQAAESYHTATLRRPIHQGVRSALTPRDQRNLAVSERRIDHDQNDYEQDLPKRPSQGIQAAHSQTDREVRYTTTLETSLTAK
jgi:hypothetical protein